MKYKILHTADWHFGRKFLGISAEEDENIFINYILRFINENKINAVIVSGDIYDSVNPPVYAEALYYSFLKNMIDAKKPVVITSGNHDSKNKVSIPSKLVSSCWCHIYTSPKVCEILPGVFIFAVPFLTYNDLSLDIRSCKFTELELKYKEKLIDAYKQLLSDHDSDRIHSAIKIAMGHFSFSGFTMNGGSVCSMYGSDVIETKWFDRFNYVAMGHLHKAQQSNNIVYPGSPFICNFGETDNAPSFSVIEIDTEETILKSRIIQIESENYRKVYNFYGNYKEICNQIDQLDVYNCELKPFVRVKIKENVDQSLCYNIKKMCEEKNMNLLKILFSEEGKKTDGEDCMILKKDRTPFEIFSDIIDKSGEPYTSNKEKLLECFSEIVKKTTGGTSL